MIFRHLLNMQSHPTWVRGLKQALGVEAVARNQSHPTWVRGLKQACYRYMSPTYSRTLRGCVD